MFAFYEHGHATSFPESRTEPLDKEFGKVELTGMNIAELRKKLDLSQEAFAARVGLSSKSHISEIENGGRCSVRVALEIERLSDGEIPASTLNPDVALVEEARGIETTNASAA